MGGIQARFDKKTITGQALGVRSDAHVTKIREFILFAVPLIFLGTKDDTNAIFYNVPTILAKSSRKADRS